MESGYFTEEQSGGETHRPQNVQHVYTGAKDLINCEVAEYSVITIKQQYFGYGGVTPKQNGATHLQQDLHKYDDVRQKELKNGHNTP